ncbi:MAG: hypothetical protein HY934_06415, partial [Candidatus Firestonebacteria bacterium]|nr:hypothetical protein [Candidatus Firestonebacteria bacterium]
NGTCEINDKRYIKGVVGSYIVLGPESFLSFFNGDANLTLEAYFNGSGYARQERKNYFEALDHALPISNEAIHSAMTGLLLYTGLPPLYKGALYGLSPVADFRTLFSHNTPVSGLYQAGQTSYPGYGVPTAAMSGIFTAEVLMKTENIIK